MLSDRYSQWTGGDVNVFVVARGLIRAVIHHLRAYLEYRLHSCLRQFLKHLEYDSARDPPKVPSVVAGSENASGTVYRPQHDPDKLDRSSKVQARAVVQ